MNLKGGKIKKKNVLGDAEIFSRGRLSLKRGNDRATKGQGGERSKVLGKERDGVFSEQGMSLKELKLSKKNKT